MYREKNIQKFKFRNYAIDLTLIYVDSLLTKLAGQKLLKSMHVVSYKNQPNYDSFLLF